MQTAIKRVRVLVADDSPSYRRLLVRLLAMATGFEVVGEAANGEEAVELVRALQPDVVLMDFKMPRMDGLAAARAIHAEWPHIRVFILIAVPDMVDSPEVLRAGLRPILAKDLPAPAIIATVRAEVHGAHVEPAVPSRAHVA